MISIWIRKLLMSQRAVFVVMFMTIILVLFAGLWGLSFIWEPARYILWFFVLLIVYVFVSENFSWDISNKVKRISRLVDSKKYPKALEKYEKILQQEISKVDGKKNGELYRTIKYGQGRCFLEIGIIDGKPETLYKAIECYDEVLMSYPKEYHSTGYAQILANIGASYRNLADVTNCEANTIKAIETLNEANAALKVKSDPLLYSYIQSQLGLAYEVLSKFQDKHQNLNKAAYAFTEAKNMYLSKKRLKDAFYINILFGRVMVSLIQTGVTDENISKATKSLEDGITFLSGIIKKYPIEHFPESYAYVHQYLGIAFTELSKVKDRYNNTIKAKAAFQESLRVFTEKEYPNFNRMIVEYL